MAIVDENDNPIISGLNHGVAEDDKQGEPFVKETSPANGENLKAKEGMQDVRTVPRGLLQYNLGVCVFDLKMNQGALEQMAMIVKQQKMVVKPKEMLLLEEQQEQLKRFRDIIVGELNDRYADADAAYRAKLGIEIDEFPTPGEEKPPPELS